ncbi:histone H1-I [Physcomitrium patens]|uniref:H15 domain-containing protein n=1 Tax=Physcomitrium patens TaxID=3218 RepID=A9REP3_PHYPA|nr:histone H1-I-like [Physcomitrium patens]PNR42512.1 hypothetical protein PHYPA_017342 [Physcomitrium patens]|eukprot:XP_024392363.1 histone H1-I-like [Physcomitrella patens]
MAARQALVRDAMSHLKMRNGASLAQIRKQLVSTYTGKIDIKNKMLTTALKGLVEKGQVEKYGANFKLASAAKANPEDEAQVPSRRHHRRKHRGGSRRRHHQRRRHKSRKRHHSRRQRHHKKNPKRRRK